ncbi:MBL fold metallo-hydrolase [Brachybacterium sacelli]|uniref:Glyoxylase-like metal-dependent hydrolase (Beta-lactamase superfamily II) n=1 Tax=Brachybacterium sacelli TaxID=173364 RepID=A0ABS4X440_9MICO|nr:MBL fold metallo-hydrolase [Brachybacterium sacelli]MBP2383234.1 glyoxylase-like metal-dependent hydrolase (beta-lactamase superfamily II) [Brachybacterium sacelli]
MAHRQIQEVASEVFMVEGIASNWTVVREGRDLTLIDAGYPKDLENVLSSLEHLGGRIEDVRGVLITHAHVDHVGSLPGIQAMHPIPMHAHDRELPMLRGEVHEQASARDVVRRCWRPRTARWAFTVARAGGLSTIHLPQARAVSTGTPLDLPGGPIALACSGHTSGHTVYHLPQAGVVVTGDALVTGHQTSARLGPQLIPEFFTHDPATARSTLDVLAELGADAVVPGHGPSWRGPVREAVDRARAAHPAGSPQRRH